MPESDRLPEVANAILVKRRGGVPAFVSLLCLFLSQFFILLFLL